MAVRPGDEGLTCVHRCCWCMRCLCDGNLCMHVPAQQSPAGSTLHRPLHWQHLHTCHTSFIVAVWSIANSLCTAIAHTCEEDQMSQWPRCSCRAAYSPPTPCCSPELLQRAAGQHAQCEGVVLVTQVLQVVLVHLSLAGGTGGLGPALAGLAAARALVASTAAAWRAGLALDVWGLCAMLLGAAACFAGGTGVARRAAAFAAGCLLGVLSGRGFAPATMLVLLMLIMLLLPLLRVLLRALGLLLLAWCV
jgi:hypothetical protein